MTKTLSRMSLVTWSFITSKMNTMEKGNMTRMVLTTVIHPRATPGTSNSQLSRYTNGITEAL